MKDKAASAIVLRQNECAPNETLRMRLGALLPLAMLCVGWSLWLRAAFPSISLSVPFAALEMLAVGAGLLFCCGTRAAPYVYGGATFVGVLCLVVFRASFTVPINDYFSALQHVSGHIFLHYETAERIWPVVVSVICGSAVLFSRAAYSGSLFWLLPALVPMLEGAVSAVVPFGVGAALCVAAMALLLRRGGLTLRMMLGRAATVGVCLLLSVCIALPLRSMPDNRLFPALREAAHGILYDSRSNPMPEGRLSKLHGFRRNDTPALSVTLEQPQALYLRGSIYETYTGSDWKALPAETRDGYASLFYWLHDGGYYGQTQVGAALRESGAKDSRSVTVRTLSACRAHGYLPYGAYGVTADETLIGDAEIPKQETFRCFADDNDALRSAQRRLADAPEQHASFLLLEQSFADYAGKVDLTMTDAARAVLDREFASRVPASRSLTEIRAAIHTYLDETLTYDETACAAPRHADFLQALLEGSRCGFSVQYATAAVLLLRYCGVPARYVEGYYLPASGTGTLTVTEAHAHAWAEMYLDGIGFVPFEVTPGYASDERPQKDGERTLQRAGQTPSVMPDTTPSQDVQPPPEPEVSHVWWMLPWLLLPVLALAGAALWIGLRRRKLRRALRRIDEADPREAVLRRYGYTLLLRQYCADPMPDSEAVADAVRQAQFSDHTITDAHRAQTDAFAQAVRQDCLRQWSLPRRLYYRFLRCIIL